MTTWVTADLHLNHINILKYCPASRSHYKDHIEMTELLIAYWNNTVQHDDTVWILGDVSMGHEDHMAGNISRLMGQKHLVYGNHDRKIRQSKELKSLFASVQPHKKLYLKQDLVVVMNHYPQNVWDDMKHGSVMLHGHCHGTPTGIKGRIKDIGVDTNEMKLYVLEDVVNELLQTPVETPNYAYQFREHDKEPIYHGEEDSFFSDSKGLSMELYERYRSGRSKEE